MPSNTQDNVKELKPKKEGHKKNLKWYLGAAFLVLTVAVFVLAPLAGVFAPSSSSLIFGEYDGTPIEYAYGNYFYDQQQNIASTWDEDTTDENYQWQVYQIWKQAFDNTVINTAIMNEVEKSGIFVTDSAVDTYLLTQGPYIDENGSFSSEAYNATSSSQKSTIRESINESIAYQTVVNDMFSSIYSANEIEFIKSIAASEKSFDYVVFPLSDYPLELVKNYAQMNLMDFTELKVSIITLSADDADAAKSIYDEIKSGAVLFEDAAKNNSTDGFAEDGGEAGWFNFYDVAQILADEDKAHAVYSLGVDGISEMYETEYGFNIFRVNEGPRLPDLEDPEKIDFIKSFMISRETAMVTDYMSQQAELFSAAVASDGFKVAAVSNDYDIHTAEATPLNYNSSTFMKSFAYTDADQYLAGIQTDDAALKALYATEQDELSQVISIGDGVLVAYCTEAIDNSESLTTLEMFYPYMVQQILQTEYTTLVFDSEKLTDNFMTVFFSDIMQNS